MNGDYYVKYRFIMTFDSNILMTLEMGLSFVTSLGCERLETLYGHLVKMERNKHISPGRQSFFHYGHRCSSSDIGRTVNTGQSWCQQGPRLYSHGGWGEVSTTTSSGVDENNGRDKMYTNRHRHCQHYLYNHPYHPYQGNSQNNETNGLPRSLCAEGHNRESAHNKETLGEYVTRGAGDRHTPYLIGSNKPQVPYAYNQADGRKRCHSETDLENITSYSQLLSIPIKTIGVQHIYSFDDCHLPMIHSRDADGQSIAEPLEVLYIEALTLSDPDSSGSEADVSHSASTIAAHSVSDLTQDVDVTESEPLLDVRCRTNDQRLITHQYQQIYATDDPYSLESLFRSL